MVRTFWKIHIYIHRFEYFTYVQISKEFLDALALKLYVCFLSESYAVENGGHKFLSGKCLNTFNLFLKNFVKYPVFTT